MHKNEILRIDLNVIYTVLEKIAPSTSNNLPREFAYGIARNKREVLAELQLLAPDFNILDKYEKERHLLCKKYAKKDSKGKYIIINNEYSIIEDKHVIFKNELQELANKYSINDVLASLSLPTDINFYYMELSSFPETVDMEDIEILLPLIKNEDSLREDLVNATLELNKVKSELKQTKQELDKTKQELDKIKQALNN